MGDAEQRNMAYKIKYLPLAVQDLTDIAQYLSGFLSQDCPARAAGNPGKN